MRTQNRPLRVISAVAAGALLLAQAPPQAEQTQSQPAGDPPARVGRVAEISGSVSFHGQDDSQWVPARLNYPVAPEEAFWTQPNSRAVIEVSASRIALASDTELDVAGLTDTAFEATEPQGELYLDLRAARPEETYAVQTPRGLVTLTVPGRYEVAAGDTQDPTIVTVVEGSAHVEGPGVSLDVGSGQAATISGTDAFQGEVGPAQPDAFLSAMLQSEHPPQASPSAVAALPGGDDLAQYGTWSDSPDYGQVWYPQVASGWAPYREGYWSYVPPWGWTWVDNEPWGFAPFHYGRWAEIGGRWAWVPGDAVAVPVYAPALVTFFGIGAVAAVGIGAALAQGSIGWLPLGPHEPFHPWYHASAPYLQRINVGRPGGPPLAIGGFANRHAAIVVPGGVMTGSRPIGGAFQPVDPARLALARPVLGRQPVPPPPPGMHAVAPGPMIHAMPAGIAAGAVPRLPPLHPPALPAAAGVPRPFTAPLLRTPPAPGQIAPPAFHQPGLVGPGVGPHAPRPGPNGGAPSPQLYRPPAATFHEPVPQATIRPPPPGAPAMPMPPPAAFHPPLPTVVHPSAPPPVPPAMVHTAPTPPPQPQFRPAPPAAQPVAHPPPPEQNARHKRPGEQ
jgi:hypothetical protein